MKLIVVSLIVLTLLFAGCQVPTTGKSVQEDLGNKLGDIDSQIAKIEQELRKQAGYVEPAVEEVTETHEEAVEPLPEVVEETTEISKPEEATAAKTLTVQETELVRLHVDVEDDSETTVTYSEPLDSKGEWQTNYGDAGSYTVTVTVDDGEYSTTQTVNLVVEKKNRAPKIIDITLE
jgi:hypothetical protein